MRKAMLILLLVWSSTAMFSPDRALAQDNPAAATGSEPAQEQGESDEVRKPTTDEDKSAAAADSQRSRLDEFVPTEEISEDNSVSFPVDI